MISSCAPIRSSIWAILPECSRERSASCGREGSSSSAWKARTAKVGIFRRRPAAIVTAPPIWKRKPHVPALSSPDVWTGSCGWSAASRCRVSRSHCESPRAEAAGLDRPLHHHLLDLGDRLRGIEALGANIRAIHDRVAAIKPERILEMIESFAGRFVARIREPAIGLQKRRWTKIALRIPPIGRAGRGTAGAEDALVKPVELGAIVRRLAPLGCGRRRLRLQMRPDGGI